MRLDTLVGTGQLEEDLQLGREIAIRPIDIHVLDGKSGVLGALARVERLRDDAVHARERAHVDDSVHPFPEEAVHLAGGQNHLAAGTPLGQVRRPGPEDVAYIRRLLVAGEVLREGSAEGGLVGALDPVPDLGAQHGAGEATPGMA